MLVFNFLRQVNELSGVFPHQIPKYQLSNCKKYSESMFARDELNQLSLGLFSICLLQRQETKINHESGSGHLTYYPKPGQLRQFF